MGRIIRADERPRAIFVPVREANGIIGLWNEALLASLHLAYPEFVHGMNAEDFKKNVYSTLDGKYHWCVISLDGSNHDGHQHHRLMEIVDNRYLHMMHPLLRDIYVVRGGWDEAIFGAVFEQALSTTCSVTLRAQNYSPLITMRLKGTTFSGHPLRTTFGNTLRVILYRRYEAHCAGLRDDEFVLKVTGDDSVLWVTPEKVKQLSDSILRLTSTVKSGIRGLG